MVHRSTQTGIPAGEFSVADIQHACRCAQRASINIENEAQFLMRLADHRNQSHEDIALDTEMNDSSYDYLLWNCGTDTVAVNGLKRIRAIRQQVANHIRRQSKSLDERSSRLHD